MRSEAAARALLLLALVLPAPAAAGAPVLVERVVAVVDDRPLLLSEARVLQALQGMSEDAAVEALVGETLMDREAQRLPRTAPTPEEERSARESLLRRLETAGLAADAVPGGDALRRVARRQLVVLKYVEYRFRPQVRVSDEAVRQAYEARHGAEAAPPALEAVEAELRAGLEREDLDRRLEAWIAELRSGARIRRNPRR